MNRPVPSNASQPSGPPPLRVIAAGGTFDKHYDELSGQLGFGASHVPGMMVRARISGPHEVELLPLQDSLDMHEIDRQRVLEACRAAAEDAIVVIHGTDTMSETARVIGTAGLARTIVLTGAMIPHEIANSDALFNLGFACACAQILPAGVYIAMNGRVFDWTRVRKNRAAGVFEPIPEP